MSSFSIKGISQLNLSLNIDNKKNIENIQIIINDLKELIDILSFSISDVSTSTQQQIAQNDQEIEQQIENIVYDATGGDGGDSGTGGGTGGDGGDSGTGGGTVADTNAVVAYYN